MADFERALGFTLDAEGGFSNRKNDKGGPTNFGIIQKTYDAWRKRKHYPVQSVRKITRAEADEIYRFEFWIPVHGDELPEKIGIAVFDWAVNSSPHTAVKKLQEVLVGSGLRADGTMGPMTIRAAHEEDDEHLVYLYLAKRRAFYNNIVAGDPTQLEFLHGWMNRLTHLAQFLGLPANGSAPTSNPTSTSALPPIDDHHSNS